MQVYGYIRVSTDEQAEKGNSLFEQEERIKAYCKVKDWPEPILFIDDGYSAKNIFRPDLTKLLDTVKINRNGIVITTKLDRLSRKLFDILNLTQYFEKYDFNYVSATEGFDTSTPAGRLCLQMLGMVAEFERERNGERVRDNMLSLARNSTKIITRPCFGYDVIDGKMQVNIEEALIIQKMAQWAIAGEGSRTIAKRLNNDLLVKTKEGNEWHDKVVRDLLRRETLIGEFVYNKTTKKNNKVIKRPESEWIRLEDHHDPILDKDTFDKIIEIFEGRKTVGKHISDDTYLLTGLVVCAHCRSKMNGKTNRNFSKRLNQENIHYTYLCDGYLKKGTCYHHFIRRDELESLIIDNIKEVANSDPRTIKLVISKPLTNSINKESIRAKLEKIDKKMQKHLEAYSEDLITHHDLKNATEKATAEREALQKLLNEDEDNQIEIRKEQLHKKAKASIQDISSEDRVKVKQTIRQFIDCVEVSNGYDLNIIWRSH